MNSILIIVIVVVIFLLVFVMFSLDDHEEEEGFLNDESPAQSDSETQLSESVDSSEPDASDELPLSPDQPAKALEKAAKMHFVKINIVSIDGQII